MALTTFSGASMEQSDPGKTDLIKRWIYSNLDYSGLDRGQLICFRGNTSHYSMELPAAQRWTPDVRTDIVDQDVKDDLEATGLINWCPPAAAVLPLCVPRDGNCLLHSVSVSIWGVSDRGLMLRRVLGLVLSIDNGHRLRSRWHHHQQQQLSPLVASSPEHVRREWHDITQCLDPDHKAPAVRHTSRAAPHRFLEAVHVYALANVIRRPIVVVTDPLLRTFAGVSLQDNDMGGIYLPLEWSWEDTCLSPVFVAYTYCHFSPLLLTAGHAAQGPPPLLPLVSRQLQQLPVRFLLQGEGAEVGELLRRYLAVQEVGADLGLGGRPLSVLCVQLQRLALPDRLSLAASYFRGRLVDTSPAPHHHHPHHHHPASYGVPEPGVLVVVGQPGSSLGAPPDRRCVVPGCRLYGDLELAMMCSRCFQDYSAAESRQMARAWAAPSSPSAPPPSMRVGEAAAAEQPLSMMTQRCQDGCGFRCSTHTFPYCHQCAPRHRHKEEEGTARGQAGMGSRGQGGAGWREGAAQRGGSHPPGELGRLPPATGAQSPRVSAAGEKGGEAVMSPTLALEKGSLVAPLTPPEEEPSDQFLFGSGRPPGEVLPPAPSPMEVLPPAPPPGGEVFPPAPSPMEVLLPAPNPGEVFPPAPPPGACGTEGCCNGARYRQQCAQCFISSGMLNDPALRAVRMMSITSTPSSAPEAGAGAHTASPYTHHAARPAPGTPNPPSHLRRQSSSLSSVSEMTARPQASTSRVDDWLTATAGYHGQETQGLSLPETSLGLPERQLAQMEPLKNDDLVVSGLCCGSAPRCVGAGCQNNVQKEGQLCPNCNDILRNFHQPRSRGNASVAQETGPDRPRCRTEGCDFYGIHDSLGFCSDCNARLMNRQLEEEQRRRVTQPPAAQRSAAIPPPPSPVHRPQHHGTRCIAPGCSMYGDPQQAHMCSAHYRARYPAPLPAPLPAAAGLSPKHRRLDPSASMQTASLEYQPGRNQGHPVQVVDPVATRSVPTVTGGREGDRRAAWITGQIGEPYVQSHPPIVTGQRPQPSTPAGVMGRNQPSLAGESSSLGETFSRVVGQPEECIHPYCSNYGNAHKSGMCNSCWDTYERDRLHNLRHGFGEDVID